MLAPPDWQFDDEDEESSVAARQSFDPAPTR